VQYRNIKAVGRTGRDEMQGRSDRTVVKQGLKLLLVRVILGAAAAGAAMALMRAVDRGEILVALFVGLVPGIVEKSFRKLVAGAVLALIGYGVGARVGVFIAKSASGVPLGHWAITGAFIGMTAGISRKPGQWFSFRVVVRSFGIVYGFVLGMVFGLMGDIGGFFTIPAYNLPLFYYMREVSLVCAGVFINLGVGVACILTASLDNGLWRVARAVEKAET
jgi:hypothetical protein